MQKRWKAYKNLTIETPNNRNFEEDYINQKKLAKN